MPPTVQGKSRPTSAECLNVWVLIAMKTFRTVVVGAAATSLLWLPLAASASPPEPSSATSLTAARYDTSVRFLDFDHTRVYGRSTTIRGQVVVPALGGAVRGLRVKLYRHFDGSSRWTYLATKFTSQQTYPKFRFKVVARANADYRVVYAGNKKLQPSRSATGLSVYRHFDATIDDGTGRFHGRITPDYADRIVHLDRRACATCGWRRIRSQQTGSRGTFSFVVNAPGNGRYFWRTSTPASIRFVRSYSAVFTTQLG